jgi:hypothetical protein
MQTYDPLKPGYINPDHLEMLTPEARSNVITVDPDVPRQADVSEAPVAEGLTTDIARPLTLDERLAALEARNPNAVEASRAMLSDTDGLTADEVIHVRHILSKYFANDRPDDIAENE